jgi:hypothetical protein
LDVDCDKCGKRFVNSNYQIRALLIKEPGSSGRLNYSADASATTKARAVNHKQSTKVLCAAWQTMASMGICVTFMIGF